VEDAESFFRIFALQQAGKFSEAEIFVERFLEKHPDSPSVLVEGGFIALQLGETARAEGRFARVLELDPGHKQARVNLANIFLTTGRLDRAEAEYVTVLRDDPEDLYALYNLGTLLADRGLHGDARDYLRRFVELYPQHDRASAVRARLQQNQSAAPDR
jgi:tetratricopeptide (TPR) repeat protein